MVAQPRRDRLHAMVDALPERDLADVEQLLEHFANADPPLRSALLAPIDDEPLTDAQSAAIERSRHETAGGEYVSDADLDEFLARHAA